MQLVDILQQKFFNRIDFSKDNLGLTNFKGDYPTKSETEIAKNYLKYAN